MNAMWPVPLFAGAIGLVLGSFAVTSAVRATRGDAAIAGRSRCDGCAESLTFVRTLPVVSFLVQRGRCASCGARIDPAHLCGELAGAGILVTADFVHPIWRGALIGAIGILLLATSAIDARTQRLPSLITLVVAGLCLVLSASKGMTPLVTGGVSAALSAVILGAVRALSRTKDGLPGLGLGDVKLVSALALWLGPATPWALTLAALAGLILAPRLSRHDGRMAFGPFIAVAGWITGCASEMWMPSWPT